MLFEFLVLAATGWNFFARPRIANLKITRALHKDGISFFVVFLFLSTTSQMFKYYWQIMTLLRTFNVGLAIRGKPATTMLAVL